MQRWMICHIPQDQEPTLRGHFREPLRWLRLLHVRVPIYWQHISKLYWKHFDYSAVPHLSWSLIVHIKMHWTLYNYSSDHILYTCQLFLRYKREIFILGVLGILKMTWSFPKIPEEVRNLPKKSEDVRRLRKTSEVCQRRSYRENSRSRGRYCHLFILHMVNSFLNTWVWVNIFLEIVSSKTATTHIFQSGVRNWSAGVSGREI